MSNKPSNFAAIQLLHTSRPYEQATRQTLEEYVKTQCTEATYDFEANKALIKNYQCFPEHFDADVCAKVLALSLMRLPLTDLLALTSLVPSQKVAGNPKIKFIEKCNTLLESGKYEEFWAECTSGRTFIDSIGVNGFCDAIRQYIANTVRSTFRNMSRDQFQSMIGLSGKELDSFCASCSSIEESKGDLITLSPCSENQVRMKHFEGSLRFDEVLRLVNSIRKADSYC